MAGGFFGCACVDAPDMAKRAGPFGLELEHMVELSVGRPERGNLGITEERAKPGVIENAGHGSVP
jgi:hypothetical protein